MSRSFVVLPGGAVLALAGITLGCALRPNRASLDAPAQARSTSDRLTVRTAEQVVVVDSPDSAGRHVERMVVETGGYIERSSGGSNGAVRIEGRVPAARLDSIMAAVAGLGEEKRRRTTGADVTDQYTDLEARLRSAIALRDRLQQLLARAVTLDEVLKLEQEIARLQSEIDALQARIDQLQSRVELAALSVSLDRKRVLGPLAWVGHGALSVLSKLFVIR